MARSGDKDAARQLLDQLQSMLENLQMAQPGQCGDSDMEQAMNELGDIIRKQQQLRDKTFKQGQDSRRDRMRGQRGRPERMGDLQQDQQGLRDRLQKLLDELAKHGMCRRSAARRAEATRTRADRDQRADRARWRPGRRRGRLCRTPTRRWAMPAASSATATPTAPSDSQGRALEALRKGAQKLAQQMQQGDDDGRGRPGQSPRPAAERAATAPTRSAVRCMAAKAMEDQTVQIPGEIDVQRARRILEELRRRLGDPAPAAGRTRLHRAAAEGLLTG